VSAVRERVHGIDVLRGLVMVLMALDHARDFFGDVRLQPEDLARSTPALFATRWVTHLCAPVFVLLAGTSAYLHGRRLPSRAALARFLASRGLWLVLLELTVVGAAWQASFALDRAMLQVIWAIGLAMLALAALVFLPARIVGLVGLAIVAGHNLLDGVDWSGWWWELAHEAGARLQAGGFTAWVLYPFLPWIGVMALGYGLGPLFERPPHERRGVLLVAGLGGIAIFALLRAFRMYGEPDPWGTQDTLAMTVASFLSCTKYPPSLQFLAMTLGPGLVLLAAFDEEPGFVGRRLRTLGRVPLFFYVAHLWVLSLGSAATHLATTGEWFRVMRDRPFPDGYGNGLGAVYLAWALVVLALYPACAWYAGVKRRRRSALLSYL
jgi:uncharacterized membrane protein